jgi:hypothetical protein
MKRPQPSYEAPDARSSAVGAPATQDDSAVDWSRRVVLANLGVIMMSTSASAAAATPEQEQGASQPGEARDR